MLLPVFNRTVLAFKPVGLVFLAGLRMFANIGESRIVFEVIPFALDALELFSYGQSGLDHLCRPKARGTAIDSPWSQQIGEP
jgi:hypothetical protein